ncbi:C-X-C motif chemokine 9-like isoform X3 [Amblyraja radiata]|uniref:C-X-C motif chemokine 9-like isoform X3 n=1 Tax=Amblyraja radiata TaxID=386614 RepID=UPI001401D167|nr:C-X-C motif chemokine 9-like isoform X3 [Amblyraja radiata]
MDRAASVTILILLLCAITTQGIPILGLQGRCRCIRTTSVFIRPKLIQRLVYIPPRSQCETAEIIITLKNRKRVCVNPDAKWLQAFINARRGS